MISLPVGIPHQKYERQLIEFNLGFLVNVPQIQDPNLFTILEGVLRKVTKHLIEAEEEQEAIWKDKNVLALTLERVYSTLVKKTSPQTLTLSPGNVLFLSLFNSLSTKQAAWHRAKISLKSSSVAILSSKLEEGKVSDILQNSKETEIILHRILPFIKHQLPLKWLALSAQVSTEIAQKCIKNLAYYGLVDIVEIFSFSNRYRATRKLPLLLSDKALASRCWDYCTKQKIQFYERTRLGGGGSITPLFQNQKELKLFSIYSQLCNSKSLGQFCSNYDIGVLNERRLVNFGVIQGLIVQMNQYFLIERKASSSKKVLGNLKRAELFDNVHSLQDICVELDYNREELFSMLRRENIEFTLIYH